MMGTLTPCMRSRSWIFGSASAAASLFTVTRTSSEPARASAAICVTEDWTSAVSVLVIDWTTTGASEPTRTPPTFTVTDFLRRISAMGNSDFIMRWRAYWACGSLGLHWVSMVYPRKSDPPQRHRDTEKCGFWLPLCLCVSVVGVLL